MCAVSAISDYVRSQADDFWNTATWPMFQEMIEVAKRLEMMREKRHPGGHVIKRKPRPK